MGDKDLTTQVGSPRKSLTLDQAIQALADIEKTYYAEGKDAIWRAAHMRAIATEALSKGGKPKPHYEWERTPSGGSVLRSTLFGVWQSPHTGYWHWADNSGMGSTDQYDTEKAAQTAAELSIAGKYP
jgi:hypothetical protein